MSDTNQIPIESGAVRFYGPVRARAEAGVPVYEDRLDRDLRWALNEGSRHFHEDNAVFNTMRKIASRLKSLGVPYAVVGGMALFKHGFRRFTEDVDVLVTNEDLIKIHKELEGRGYLPPFKNSKNLRDTEDGVKIEFLITGGYPGDGKPKPVAFPDPRNVSVEIDGINYINLSTLVDLKLASGMSNIARGKDLIDVLELIKAIGLREDFAEQLDPYVRAEFTNLCRQATKRYVRVWRNNWLTVNAKSIAEMSRVLREASEELERMRADGIILENDAETGNVHALLVTTDPEVAEKHGLVDEADFWGTNPDDKDGEASTDLPHA